MAESLDKTGISAGNEIDAAHISKLYDLLTGNTEFDNVKMISDLDMGGKTIKNVQIPRYYGLRFDENTDSYTRLGMLAGQPIGESPNDEIMPLHQKICCGLLTDSGEFTKFNPSNWDEDIEGNSVVRDGSMGQVVMRIPKTYVKYNYSAGLQDRYISEYDLEGFHLHPCFRDGNGGELDYIYIGVYKASMYDVSAGAYIGGQGADSYNPTDGDKIASVAGVYAHTNEKRSEYREMAANRGAGWYLQYFWLLDLKNLYLTIEYADNNVQNIWEGITGVSYDDWETYNDRCAIVQCGAADSLASGTGEKTVTVSDFPTTGESITVKVPKWRGLEDFFGHLWELLDGFNIKNVESELKSYAYLCDTPGDFADDTETNYENAGELPIADGYIQEMFENGILLSKSVGGSSSTYYADYFYTRIDNYCFDIIAVDQGNKTFTVSGDQTGEFSGGETVYVHNSTGNDQAYTVSSVSLNGSNNTEIVVNESIPATTADGLITNGFGTDWQVGIVGGSAHNGGPSGVFCVYAYYDSSADAPHLGARLCYRPQN